MWLKKGQAPRRKRNEPARSAFQQWPGGNLQAKANLLKEKHKLGISVQETTSFGQAYFIPMKVRQESQARRFFAHRPTKSAGLGAVNVLMEPRRISLFRRGNDQSNWIAPQKRWPFMQ